MTCCQATVSSRSVHCDSLSLLTLGFPAACRPTPPPLLQTIVNKGQSLSTHTFGCRLVQRVLQFCSIPELRERVVSGEGGEGLETGFGGMTSAHPAVGLLRLGQQGQGNQGRGWQQGLLRLGR